MHGYYYNFFFFSRDLERERERALNLKDPFEKGASPTLLEEPP